MPLSFATWKFDAARAFRSAATDLRQRAPDTLYFSLCAMVLLLVMQAIQQRGEAQTLIPAALGVAAGVGTNLLADLVKHWWA